MADTIDLKSVLKNRGTGSSPVKGIGLWYNLVITLALGVRNIGSNPISPSVFVV